MLNLGNHLREARPTRAIFTTFALSPSLFDSHVVRKLLEGGCEEIVLLTDRIGYEALLAERSALSYAGCSYWVCSVDRAPFAFHPKVALLWSKNEARLYVMSANLTHGGLWRNAEIVDCLSWHRQTGGSGVAIRKAAEWCERLPEALGLPRAIRAPLKRMVGELKGVLPTGSAADAGALRAEFIHNLDEALLPQVLRQAPGDVDEVVVAAPFYGPGLEPVVRIAEAFPKAKITAGQESSTGTINPSVSAKVKRRVTVAKCRLPGAVRPWHAKFILLKGRDEWLFASGSPNITGAALLDASGDGNVEASVIRVSAETAISRLVGQLKLEPVPWSNLVYKPITTDSSKGSGPSIRWAEIIGLRLKVEVSGVDPHDTGAVKGLSLLLRTGSRDGITPTATHVESDVVVIEAPLPRDIDAELGSSIFTSLEARSSARSPYSQLRALVMCPDEINAPVAMRRFRAAVRAIQRNEMQTDDLREVLAFVRHNLSGLLLHLQSQSGFQRADKRKSDPALLPDRPAVTLIDDEQSGMFHGLTGGGVEGNLLAGLPAIFRSLLQPHPCPPSSGGSSPKGADENSEDDEDGDTEDVPEYDPDALAADVRSFLDWVRESFNSDPVDDADASRQWAVRSQLVEFACVFARFYYLRGEDAVDPESLTSREYLNQVSSLLMPVVSASGLAFAQPIGWFVRVKLRDGEGKFKASASLVAQMLFQVHELICGTDSPPAGQLSVSPLLEGLDLICGSPVEEVNEVRSALTILLAAYRQPENRLADVLESARTVRGVDTPEQQALAKFNLLLSLQEATGQVQALKGKLPRGAAPGKELLAAIERQMAAQNECQRRYPQETDQYLALVTKGKWNSLVPVRGVGTNACPRCHMSLPLRLAAGLKDVMKLTPCPACMALIVPIPLAATAGVRHERG